MIQTKLTKFNTVKRKANVGERILITDMYFSNYSNGDIGEVHTRYPGGVGALINGISYGILDKEYEVINENKTEASRMQLQKRGSLLVKAVPTPNYQETIGFTENEDGTYSLNFAKMPGLVFVSYDGVGSFDQLFVHGDFKAEAQRIKIESEVGELTKYTIESMPAIKTEVVEKVAPVGHLAVRTPQEIRDDIIEQAKRDVAEILGEYASFDITIGRFVNQAGTAKFIVNAEKRTVVALIHGYFTKDLYHRGIAKCAPTDCFNAHIGKAISLRRALGLEVPAEYLNAPQPTEVRVGDVIKRKGWTEGKPVIDDENPHPTKIRIATANRILKHLDGRIIDDTRDGANE
ncbi:hypothetical protein [Cytobacillus massiliigabonensis]|uniref:hypothetical protein n=1 Tax=Cytobacillus massiliigabonensis TaxID=1871011 RepID=UPI000C859706|nr:hypothetical protein [Cytobacillus massiliigabonensis]